LKRGRSNAQFGVKVVRVAAGRPATVTAATLKREVAASPPTTIGQQVGSSGATNPLYIHCRSRSGAGAAPLGCSGAGEGCSALGRGDDNTSGGGGRSPSAGSWAGSVRSMASPPLQSPWLRAFLCELLIFDGVKVKMIVNFSKKKEQ
jgi:hypothetical protein